MEADKRELSEVYKELRKFTGAQDLEKWAADNSKLRKKEVKALIKKAIQDGQEEALRYDEVKELDRMFITKEITREEYESSQQKQAYEKYTSNIQSKLRGLDIICILQAILPAKTLPTYEQATDAAINEAEKLIKEIHKATGCKPETAGFFASLLIQSITYVSHYIYYPKKHADFQKELVQYNQRLEKVAKKITYPVTDKKNDQFYKEQERITNEMNIMLSEYIHSIYNYDKGYRIAEDIVIRLYPEQELNRSIANLSTFRKMYQSPSTNQLARVDLNIQKATKNTITDTARIEDKDFHVIIEQYSQIQNGIRPSAKLLLDAIITKFTETGNETSTEVRLPLKEYMEMRGRKDIDEAREQANYDLAVLSHIQIPVRKDLSSEPVDMNICSYKNRIERGVIVFAFNPYFVKAVKDYWSVMSYPAEMLQVNTKKNPNTYNLFRRICEHKRMNYGRKNADRIKVETLLEACPNIPKYEAVKDIGGIDQRIIRPFERDLDVINAFKWNYCGKNGAQIDDPASYEEFVKANIKITWGEYPSQKIKPAKAKKETNKK